VSDLNRVRGWGRISKAVILRDEGICALCGGEGADTVDHIIPRSRGGDHSMSNLRAAHRVCNSRRGNMRVLPRANASRW
jgi:5-methylcytosine-specific restriction endonuclease McrA